MKTKVVAIVGVGRVGASVAYALMLQNSDAQQIMADGLRICCFFVSG
mgnify:CR=1 FL=1